MFQFATKQIMSTETFRRKKILFWDNQENFVNFTFLWVVKGDWIFFRKLKLHFSELVGTKKINQRLLAKKYKWKVCTQHECLKEHVCRYENVMASLSSHKNNMPNVSHYNTDYFLRYTHLYLLNICLQTHRYNRIPYKLAYFLRKIQTSWINPRILRIKNVLKFLEYCFYMNPNIQWNFQICISLPLISSCFCVLIR